MKPKKPTRVKTTADARQQHRTHLSLNAVRRELTPQERHEWNLLHDADLAAELEQEVEKLELKVRVKESLRNSAERNVEQLEAENARLREALSESADCVEG